jgi:hypothetical protein
MKYLCSVLLLACTSSLAVAQSPTQSSDPTEVIKFSWSKERIGWENDPFRGPIENFDEMRARARNEKRIADAKSGGSGGTDKLKRDAAADAANIAIQHNNTPSRYVFTYKTTVRNTTDKTITSIDWDYIFCDKSSEQELGRQQFTSDETIKPGKSKELLVNLTKPPTHTISVTSLNKNEADSLTGRVVVMRVVYADGSSWTAAESH